MEEVAELFEVATLAVVVAAAVVVVVVAAVEIADFADD